MDNINDLSEKIAMDPAEAARMELRKMTVPFHSEEQMDITPEQKNREIERKKFISIIVERNRPFSGKKEDAKRIEKWLQGCECFHRWYHEAETETYFKFPQLLLIIENDEGYTNTLVEWIRNIIADANQTNREKVSTKIDINKLNLPSFENTDGFLTKEDISDNLFNALGIYTLNTRPYVENIVSILLYNNTFVIAMTVDDYFEASLTYSGMGCIPTIEENEFCPDVINVAALTVNYWRKRNWIVSKKTEDRILRYYQAENDCERFLSFRSAERITNYISGYLCQKSNQEEIKGTLEITDEMFPADPYPWTRWDIHGSCPAAKWMDCAGVIHDLDEEMEMRRKLRDALIKGDGVHINECGEIEYD